MSRRPTCRIRDHVWRHKLGGGGEICEKCGTRFPCQDLACGHVDCWQKRGGKGKLPGFVIPLDDKPEDQ